ncbi:hypothetical protein Syun_016808 [Stephania yunnanensis]|uniref:Uncharacterized protein n=1 Tax=Stephania yunnanensis TaxID=152371 RepID=A0AAP0J834_9MAGN
MTRHHSIDFSLNFLEDISSVGIIEPLSHWNCMFNRTSFLESNSLATLFEFCP